MHISSAKNALRIGLSGRRVFVTGGSRGIAAAIVRGFVASGARTAFNFSSSADRDAGCPTAADDLVQELRSLGGDVCAFDADLLSPGVPEQLAERVKADFGAPDILVLSASLQINKDFLEVTERDIDLQLRLNIIANIQILQRMIPPMREARWGRIIAIGSVQAVAPSEVMCVYAMTKAALENLVCNLALENAPYGITVNNVAPGLVQTDRNAFRRRDVDRWLQISNNANPLGRAGSPDDVAGPVLFLASDAAAFITGATIFVAGGSQIPRSPTHKLMREENPAS